MAYIGKVLGSKYKIIKEIGQGGMSSVYLVWDIRLNKQWAVKEITKYRESSAIEADVIKSCDHPVLPRIVDIIYEDNATFIVMDYIEGAALNELLKKEGPQDYRVVIEWMKRICKALIYLHGLNPPIIYLDLKPSNIILKSDGSIKLIDFGISARMTERGDRCKSSMGTIGYASPEQMGYYSGRTGTYVDARSDIYSFGATMYALITGKVPDINIHNRNFSDKSVPEGVVKIIIKCMQYRREDRYQSFDEVLFDLYNYEKLDRAYRRLCVKKIGVWISLILMSVFFALASVYGYRGIKKVKDEKYEKVLTDAYEYVIGGNYEKALEEYTQAICEIDGNRNNAYIEMLKLYTDYIDAAEDGITKVSYYIDKEHDEGLSRAQLLMKVGLICFETERDYKKSAYFFEQAQNEGYKDAEIYLSIANVLSELNVDYQKLAENLDKFAKNTDSLTDMEKKLDNYVLICDVLLKYGAYIEGGDVRLVEYADKGIKILEGNGNEIVDAGYYISFHQGMLSGCEIVGDSFMYSDIDEGMRYYNKAFESCEKLLEMISNDENIVMGSSKAYEYRKAKLCKKAELLGKLLKYDEACTVYELAENEYGSDGRIFYVGHLSLLCELEERKTADVEKWDKDKLCRLYEKGNELNGIEEDYRWKRISVKLMPIIQKTGG